MSRDWGQWMPCRLDGSRGHCGGAFIVCDGAPIFYAIPNDKMDGLVPYVADKKLTPFQQNVVEMWEGKEADKCPVEPPAGYVAARIQQLPAPIPNGFPVLTWNSTLEVWSKKHPQDGVPVDQRWYAIPAPADPDPFVDAAANPKPVSTDPKAALAIQKTQMQLIPPALNEEVAKALQQGAAKYGPWNWRQNNVEIMTYVGAIRRHLDALIDGENNAPDSGVHHLGHIAAGCGIVLDALKHGTLIDNRPPTTAKKTALKQEGKPECSVCGGCGHVATGYMNLQSIPCPECTKPKLPADRYDNTLGA